MSQIQLQNHTKNLLESLNKQRLKGDRYCDVKIFSIDGSSFKAHSSVLAACTPDFTDELQIQLENGSRELELFLLADSGSVASLLDAIYSGQVTVSQAADVTNLAHLAFLGGFSELIHALGNYSQKPNSHVHENSEVETSNVETKIIKEEPIEPLFPKMHDTSREGNLENGDNGDKNNENFHVNDIQEPTIKRKRGRPHSLPKMLKTTEGRPVAKTKTKPPKKIPTPKKKSEKGVCDICEKTFLDKKRLSRHYTNIHKMAYTGNIDFGERKAVCEVCGNFFSNKSQLRNHQIRIHKFTHLAKKGKHHFCKTCNTVCITKDDLENHQRKHGLLPKLVCPMCGTLFAQRNNFLRHTKNKLCQPDANVRKGPVCDVCSHTFATSASLKCHQIAMHGFSHLSKYYCDVCQIPCCSSKDFKDHKVRHGIDEKYSCDVCNEKYTDYRALTSHRAKHPEWKGRKYRKLNQKKNLTESVQNSTNSVTDQN